VIDEGFQKGAGVVKSVPGGDRLAIEALMLRVSARGRGAGFGHSGRQELTDSAEGRGDEARVVVVTGPELTLESIEDELGELLNLGVGGVHRWM
jgi:hypothetical protein